MKRLSTMVAALGVLLGGGPDLQVAEAEAAKAAGADCCWLYCESYRGICQYAFNEDNEYCDAFYQGCVDGCRYPDGPTS
jgi:hypothetical protein